MVKEDRSKNLLSHKSLLILIKYIPHIIAIAYAIYTFLGIFGIDYNVFGCFFHVSFLTWIILYCLSIVFKYCYVHRLPIYYIGANELITCLDYYLDIELDYFTFITISLLMSCILIFGYTYYYINKLKMRDKKKFYVPKHIKKPQPGDYEVTLNWGDKVYVEKREFEKKTSKFFKNYQVIEDEGSQNNYVDLGLPSGTLWAKTNIGADSETDYGDYYGYGKGDRTHQITNGEPYYTGTENPLAASVDTATQVLGEQWHMPTKEQFSELNRYTTSEWTTINGVNGVKFTSQNGNYIFLPAGGDFTGEQFFSLGQMCSFWTSTPDGSNKAYYFFMTNVDSGIWSSERSDLGTDEIGRSIRPVIG